jgi:ribonuclease ZC3H12
VPLLETSVERKLVSNILSYFGELAQFKEKISPSKQGKPDISTAVSCYFRAINIYPFEGKYFFLLSSCSKLKDDLFSAIYWGSRAYGCQIPYTMKEKVQEFLEEARKSYITMREKDINDTKPTTLFRYFILSFLRYYNIVLTKIGYEELYTVSNYMYDCLQKYINSLLQEKNKANLFQAAELLNQIVLLIIFALHSVIEGYDENNPIESLEKPRKKFNDIENNILSKDTTKYTYGLLYHILELVLNVPEDSFISLMIPVLYYFSEYKNISDYIFTTYKPLKDKMLILYNKAVEMYEKLLVEQKLEAANIETLVKSSLVNTDRQIIGFAPFKTFFQKNKPECKGLIPPETQMVCKLNLIISCLKVIKCDSDQASEAKVDKIPDVFNLDSMGIVPLDHQTITQIESFMGLSEPKEKREKTPIILDGMNVAIRYGDDHFVAMGIKVAADYWMTKGHTVQVMLPDYCFNREDVMLRKKLAESKGDPMKGIPDDVNLLLELKAKGIAFGIPNWNYDDSYIIEYAKNKGAYIVTNDRYNDHIQNYSKGDINKKKKLKEWIRGNCISFTFIGKDFIPDPDFVNTHMK